MKESSLLVMGCLAWAAFGLSTLSIRAQITDPSTSLVSGTTGVEPSPTVVRIQATQPIAEEDSVPFDRLALAGVFTISRTGPTNNPLPVYVQYSGSATPGKDYPELPWVVSIPAGSFSTEIRVVPISDSIPEGLETLEATISNCPPPWLRPPCYDFTIEPAYERATVFLRDDGLTRASLTLTRPEDGATFNAGETIPIEVIAIDLDGYISRVEFYDGNLRIGESEIVFIRAPDPGTPILHSFEWTGAAEGAHGLSARVRRDDGTVLESNPAHITVGPAINHPPMVALIRPINGSEFPPDASIDLVAEARDPDGYVRRVEFFADGRKIGESGIEFIRPPPPGQTQTFTFTWRFLSPGPHALTARATDDGGAVAGSDPIFIRVVAPDLLPIVTVETRDAFAAEVQLVTVVNTASFRVRRFGPTNEPLTVSYSMHGTALNGVDYGTLPGTVTIPPGRRSTMVFVAPRVDNVTEGVETVILRLEGPPGEEPPRYRLGFPRRALAVIADGPWNHVLSDARCFVLGDGLRHVCFGAQAGHHFRVEASSNLRNWETLCNAPAADGAFHIVDDEAAAVPQRFYRLSVEPVPEPED